MIRFTQDYKVKPDGRAFAEGEVVGLNPASERHFLNRKVAEPAPAGTPAGRPLPLSGGGAKKPAPALAPIPENWEKLPWSQLRELASDIAGEQIRKKADAVEVVKNEIGRRAVLAAG